MRTPTMPWVLALLATAATVAATGCAVPADDDDDAEGQESGVTGGNGSVESPVVFLFESEGREAMPKCAGALLAKTFAVTAKACAREGLIVGRGADRDGRRNQVRVSAVHLPEDANADIAVLELDGELDATFARITHMPLRDGYAINSHAAVDGKGFFAPDKGEASSIRGAMFEETESHGTLLPKAGTEICDNDLGAPVCSSTGSKIGGRTISGTCGLSGLVVARAASTAAPQTVAPGSDPGADPAADANACSAGGWKVVSLGRYAEFLRSFAPGAFEPLVIDRPLLRRIKRVPPGLWGYETSGEVAACQIQTTDLPAFQPGDSSQVIRAKVEFA
jgi:hypothetical protein